MAMARAISGWAADQLMGSTLQKLVTHVADTYKLTHPDTVCTADLTPRSM